MKKLEMGEGKIDVKLKESLN